MPPSANAHGLDADHPQFDNEGPWPRRLLHVPTMTSYKWRPKNKYGRYKEPQYHAISYTWGRWRLKKDDLKPHVRALEVKGVPWSIPRVDDDHFRVTEFKTAIQQALKITPPPFQVEKHRSALKQIFSMGSPACEFIWLDVACIDQRDTPESKAEIGRQARIFRGAKQTYIWLSRLSHECILHVALQLREAASQTWDMDAFDSLNDAQSYIDWGRTGLATLTTLLEDPWFSSLWTLQEAFLCPGAFIISREGKTVEEETWSTVMLNSISARLHTIYSGAEEHQSRLSPRLKEPELSMVQNFTKVLNSRIESSGLAALWQQNPMAVFTIARFRKATFELDRIYGIMQIFGDHFKVGDAQDTTETEHQYTLSELEDELGSLLIHEDPVLSQMHIHMEPPAYGKGWRVNSISSIPPFASHPLKYGSEGGIGDEVVVCKMATKMIDCTLWGTFSGRACSYHVLQEAWNRQFSAPVNKDYGWGDRVPLNLTLDRLSVFEGLPQVQPDAGDALMPDDLDKAQHSLAKCVSDHFGKENSHGGGIDGLNRRPYSVIMLMLGQEVFGDWTMEGTKEPYSDRFMGIILLERWDDEHYHQDPTTIPTNRWQRIGICRWTSYRVKTTTAEDDTDRKILLGQRPEWREMEGVFG